jgi:hypothetical protein
MLSFIGNTAIIFPIRIPVQVSAPSGCRLVCASATAENQLVWAQQTACREKYEKRERDLAVAVKAVQMACALCQRVQEALLLSAGQNSSLKTSKDDRSPVTVAGFKTNDWFRVCDFLKFRNTKFELLDMRTKGMSI